LNSNTLSLSLRWHWEPVRSTIAIREYQSHGARGILFFSFLMMIE
jgi:hypothetical protein